MIETGEYEECDDNNVDYSQMFQQSSRLATYIVMYNHVFTAFNPIKFAKYGLFYNERYNVIICFSCRKKTPTKFKLILPGPEYIKSNFHYEECKLDHNKPIPTPNKEIYDLIQIHLHQEYCAQDILQPPSINEAPTPPPLQVLPTNLQKASPLKQQKPSSQQLSEYDSVDARLATFSNWSPLYPVNPLALAEAGFVYLGSGDSVQCVYCQGKLSQWEPGDDPIREHFKHFSGCYFILDMKMNNKDLLTGTARTVEVTDSRTERPNRNTNTSSNASVSRSSNYITMSSRIQTFKNWVHPTLTANRLSLAGFYWDDKKKSCKCFLCNVIIDNWQKDDDPFQVHALKSPDCSYILQVRGKQFVTDTVKSLSMVNRESALMSEGAFEVLNVGIPNIGIHVPNNSYENDALKDENEKLRDEKMCIVCMTEPKTILILPCAHLVCCSSCASSLQTCPVCRTKIKGTVKTFLP